MFYFRPKSALPAALLVVAALFVYVPKAFSTEETTKTTPATAVNNNTPPQTKSVITGIDTAGLLRALHLRVNMNRIIVGSTGVDYEITGRSFVKRYAIKIPIRAVAPKAATVPATSAVGKPAAAAPMRYAFRFRKKMQIMRRDCPSDISIAVFSTGNEAKQAYDLVVSQNNHTPLKCTEYAIADGYTCLIASNAAMVKNRLTSGGVFVYRRQNILIEGGWIGSSAKAIQFGKEIDRVITINHKVAALGESVKIPQISLTRITTTDSNAHILYQSDVPICQSSHEDAGFSKSGDIRVKQNSGDSKSIDLLFATNRNVVFRITADN